MPVKLNSSGGGSVTLDVPSTASTFTLNLPAQSGSVVAADASGSASVAANITTGGNQSGKYLAKNGVNVHVMDFGIGTGTGFGDSIGLYNLTSTGLITFGTNNSERARITSGGNFLIGTTSDNGARLRVNGTSYFDNLVYFPAAYNQTTGNGANAHIASDGNLFRSTSSRKYKRDIQDATFGLADVLSLRPVTYKGKSEADGDTVFGGLIAEEVHEAGLTHFVQYAEDGTPDALAYGNMVALCVKAIQELKAENDALEARLAALEAN